MLFYIIEYYYFGVFKACPDTERECAHFHLQLSPFVYTLIYVFCYVFVTSEHAFYISYQLGLLYNQLYIRHSWFDYFVCISLDRARPNRIDSIELHTHVHYSRAPHFHIVHLCLCHLCMCVFCCCCKFNCLVHVVHTANALLFLFLFSMCVPPRFL